MRVDGKRDILTLVQDTDPATRDGDNLVAQQVDVHALHPVGLHVFEAKPREVPGARGDAAQGVLRYTFHRKSGNELGVVPQIVCYSHVFDGRIVGSGQNL